MCNIQPGTTFEPLPNIYIFFSNLEKVKEKEESKYIMNLSYTKVTTWETTSPFIYFSLMIPSLIKT